MRAFLLATAGIALALPAYAAKSEPLCAAAAERLLQTLIDIYPEFDAYWNKKSDADRSAELQTITASLQADGECKLILLLPDSSMQALASQALKFK